MDIPNKLHPMRPKMLETQFTQHLHPFKTNEVGQFRGVATQEILTWGQLLDTQPEQNRHPIFDLPTPWSTPLLFEQALFDPQHPQHETSIARWQGFLALIALHQVLGLELKSEKFDLTSSVEHRFANWLNQLQPKLSLHHTANWQKGYFFWLEDTLLGMTSPTTLLVPSSEPLDEHPRIPWLKKGELGSPLNELKPWQARLLLAWLWAGDAFFRDYLVQTYVHPFSPYATSWQHLWTDFMFQLYQPLSQPISSGLNVYTDVDAFRHHYQEPPHTIKKIMAEFVPSPCVSTDWGEYRIRFDSLWGLFNKVPKSDAVSETNSPLRLIPSHGRTPAKQILLLDSALADDDDHAHQWQVYQHASLADLTDQITVESDHLWLGNQYLINSIWYAPSDFWIDDLFLVPGHDVLPGVRDDMFGFYLELGHESVLPLIPLKTFILDYFTPEDLVQRVSFERNNNQITVYLNLDLVGRSEHLISRVYDLDAHNILPHVPVLKIWPNIVSPLIHSYYTYFCAYSQEQHFFMARPLVAGKELVHVFYNGDRQPVGLDQPNNVPDMEIWKLPAFPEAFTCEAVPAKGAQRQFAGLLLLKAPQSIRAGDKKCEIAIDFGTTNTNARLKINDFIQPVCLQSQRLYSVTHTPYDIDIYEDFLAREDVKLPFLSLYKVKNLLQKDPTQFRSLLDGNIYFVETIHTFEANERLKTDLKWGREEQRMYMLAFLEQLCMQTVLESVALGSGQMHFKFSYPLAFSLRDLQALKASVKRALTHLKHDLCSGIDTEAFFTSEGVAAAYYFAQGQPNLPKALFHQGVVILDIGGGTTDITIIEGTENQIRYTSSLKFAGRDIFLQALFKHLSVLSDLGVDSDLVKTIAKEVKKSHKPSPQLIATVDAMIQEYEPILFNSLKFNFGLPQIQEFVAQLALGIGGIFYHVGQIVAYLHQQNMYARTDQLPMFFIAGNGAKLFHWFYRGPNNTNNLYYNFFKKSFTLMNQSFLGKVKDELQVHISSTASCSKPEVVEGMLVNPGLLVLQHQKRETEPPFVAGEQFHLAGKDLAESDLRLLRKDDLAQLVAESIQGENIDLFFKGYNQWLKDFIPQKVLDSKDLKDTLTDSRIHLVNLMNDIKASIEKEPHYKNTVRDEQSLFLQELKYIYSHLLT